MWVRSSTGGGVAHGGGLEKEKSGQGRSVLVRRPQTLHCSAGGAVILNRPRGGCEAATRAARIAAPYLEPSSLSIGTSNSARSLPVPVCHQGWGSAANPRRLHGHRPTSFHISSRGGCFPARPNLGKQVFHFRTFPAPPRRKVDYFPEREPPAERVSLRSGTRCAKARHTP